MQFQKFVLKSFPSPTFPEDLSCFELTQGNLSEL